MLLSATVTGQSVAMVRSTPNRKSFHAEVNCQIIDTANAGRRDRQRDEDERAQHARAVDLGRLDQLVGDAAK